MIDEEEEAHVNSQEIAVQEDTKQYDSIAADKGESGNRMHSEMGDCLASNIINSFSSITKQQTVSLN